MISTLVIFNQKGDILILRQYRGNVSRSEVQAFGNRVIATKETRERGPVVTVGSAHFVNVTFGDITLVAATKDNANCALIVKFLYKFVDLLRAYLGGGTLDENQIRKNFVLIYELLDEVLDYGYPQIMEADILKKYITQGSAKNVVDLNDTEQLKKITVAATGATSWRAEGIKYKKNEVYIDVVESVNCLVSSRGTLLRADVQGQVMVKCQLSGTPECKFGMNDKLVMNHDGQSYGAAAVTGGPSNDRGIALDDVRFHQCVRLSKFDTERAITFIPPDGVFELMSYRITENISCPFKITPVVIERGRNKIEVNLKLKAVFDKSIFATNVVVKIPVPKNAATANIRQCTMGKTKYEATEDALMWRIKKFPGMVEATLLAEVDLVSTVEEKPWSKPPISLDFVVPMFTASGLRVRFLRVQEKSNYKPVKWIRYITKAGQYEYRI
ncbi:AP-2 complex subunit mu, putative [Perkinsus marinus ATCC 50983]|uniref:AP-2 complex subunit mu, putative n=1 Tax=Perkinsus marinus (strain ATCC 50983 / TXsc) TaxID=423536 RepID=C5KP26_PERM5|nr:AP-2 complex subunit mu, putative [Perkinsus marinus ATCC 50983]XP_002782019.1 AP-2 complex subunit mu, putative [Perkinsus marinus ATCC 50983]EER03432.1 AP-2 complex subunit mu, putative [Perkinsus marinus ATCC 50983]EER13814.1 AP-2 complex subunit mu, putative [Perkinsus marinus ATCC 50983]|eukprot:XP_002771616.1 AP-2 complex subunit mu, putative [Perkinsus marinus ATCC 50983]